MSKMIDKPDTACVDSVDSRAALPQLNSDIYYAVRFENGKYYTGSWLRVTDNKESENVDEASLYTIDWMIPKDLYLQQYLYGKGRRYEVVRVKVTKTFEVISDLPKAIDPTEIAQAYKGVGVKEETEQ